MKLGDEGAITIPMTFLLLVFLAAIVGCYWVLHDWNRQVARQLELDQCTRTEGGTLLSRIRRIERSIARFRILRAAVAAAATQPQLLPAARAAVQAEYLYQESIRTLWLISDSSWILRGGCGASPRALARGYPSFPWVRDPSDSLGPGELRWKENIERDFKLRLDTMSRASAARIWFEESWRAEWVVP